MRKSALTFILILLASSTICAITELRKIKVPEPLQDSLDVSLYEHYMAFYFPAYQKMNLNYKHHAYDNDSLKVGYRSDTIGLWRVSNDTLLVYEDHFFPGACPDITYEEILELGYFMGVINLYRGLIPFIPLDAEYPFEANVSAFRIKNYGDLIGVIESAKRENGFFHVPASLFHYFSWENVKDMWQWSRFDWRAGEFKVRNKKEAGGKTLIVELEKDGVIFRAVNPKYYLKNDTVEYYDKRDEAALTGWMDSVRTGSRHRFTLQRPDYPADSAKNVRYLRTLPDSLYISRAIDQARLSAGQRAEIARTANPDTCREAYGYFFAKMIE